MGPNIVLMHLAPITWPRDATCRTDVALLAPCLDVVSWMKQVVPFPKLIQGFIDTQVSSWRSSVSLGQYVFLFAPRENYLGYFGSSVDGLPIAVL
jgi:hypothetical protein